MRTLTILAVMGLVVGACSDGDGSGTGSETTNPVVTTTTAPGQSPTDDEFTVVSDAFGEGEPIPDRFARGGENVSPSLVWRFPPEDRVEFVVVVDDPDAPGSEPFVHWLVAGIDPTALNVPEGQVPEGAVEGTNDFGDTGWGGPAPPAGETHTYRLRVMALGAPSGLDEPGFSRAELEAAVEGKVLAEATLTGLYPG